MSLAWEIVLPASDKLVLLALADYANDDGGCWPSMATLARKCSKGERTIQGAIKSLVEAGHMSRKETPGKGCHYTIHPRSNCAPAESAPPQKTAQTPAESADKPSKRTIIRNERESAGAKIDPASAMPAKPVKPTKAAKAKRTVGVDHPLPDGWKPSLTPDALRIIADWPDKKLEREEFKFRSHAATHGRLAKNWDAAFRTWIAKADERKDKPNVGYVKPAQHPDEPRNPYVRSAIARQTERSAAVEGQPSGWA